MLQCGKTEWIKGGLPFRKQARIETHSKLSKMQSLFSADVNEMSLLNWHQATALCTLFHFRTPQCQRQI